MHFNPYDDNGGTVVAMAGEDFSLIASDTRLSSGYQIHSRTCHRMFRLADNAVLGSCGFYGDTLTLSKTLVAKVKMYFYEHNKPISCNSLKQMVSNTLYYRRFFPYYAAVVLAGVDDKGRGVVYSYDPVGSCHSEPYVTQGAAAGMIQPVLDNQLGRKNQLYPDTSPLTKQRAVTLVRDCFMSAAERNIQTGDSLVIQLLTKDGIELIEFPLRKD